MEKESLIIKHIAVEGVPKSQKSRFAHLLAQKIGGRIIMDKKDNPYLRDFYDEKEGAALLSQLVFLVNRYHQQIALAQRDLFAARVICNYLFEKDKIYAYQTLTDEELIVYDRIFSILSERIAKPDLTIYLQISLATLLKRIERGGIALEKSISEKYLSDLVEAFDYFFFNYQATPLLVIKADDLDLSREDDIIDIVHQIEQLRKGPLYYVPQSYAARRAKKE